MKNWIKEKLNKFLYFLYDHEEYEFDNECSFCETELEDYENVICDECANEVG